jgi:adenosylcobinamide kinase/adenosylcobinamide-phosphate guanylyltransferase
MTRSLIIGGARSGKSTLALQIAAASALPVLFVATMDPREDEELRARVAAHRNERPASWRTIEEPLEPFTRVREQAKAGSCVVVDCVTLWVSNVLLKGFPDEERISGEAAADMCTTLLEQAAEFADWSESFEGGIVAVTNEVGTGVVPAYPLGRVFRDALGAVNSLMARRFDRVYNVTAGLALELKSSGARPIHEFGPTP